MARTRNVQDLTTLQMALVGYQIERQKIDDKIRELQAQLRGKRVSMPSTGGTSKRRAKRVLSPAARARIAAAQKRRWAEHRKRVAQSSKS